MPPKSQVTGLHRIGTEWVSYTLNFTALPPNWAEIEAKYTPSHMCTGCGMRCFKDEFQPSQWARKDCVHYCKGCVHAKTQAGTPLECIAGCGQWKPLVAFTAAQQRKTIHRVCLDCGDYGVCKECDLNKLVAEFTPGELGKTREAGR